MVSTSRSNIAFGPLEIRRCTGGGLLGCNSIMVFVDTAVLSRGVFSR